MSRPIDADQAFRLLTDQLEKETGAYRKGRNAGLNVARSMMNNAQALPTLTLNTLRDAIYEDAVAHGLWEKTDNTVQRIIKEYQDLERYNLRCVPDQDEVMREQAAKVIRTELIELEYSSDNKEAYAEELADVIIASLSVAGKLGIDIEAAVRRKMEINKGRPWKHGKEEKPC